MGLVEGRRCQTLTQLDELIESLDEASGLLRDVGEDLWAEPLDSGACASRPETPPPDYAVPGWWEGWAASATLMHHQRPQRCGRWRGRDERGLDAVRGTIGRRTRELIRKLGFR